jgi:NAD-dependent SIR2 family protein deacetylase
MFEKSLHNCEVFVSIGSSGIVLDINEVVDNIKYNILNILNILKPSDLIDDRDFDLIYYDKASHSIVNIIDIVKKKINLN